MSDLTTIAPTESIACDVDKTFYPHLFLIPAGIIITILAFFRRRKTFKKDVWGGRPGLVIPIDFLAIDSDRIGIMSVFGAATGMIAEIILDQAEGRNAWETAFLSIGTTIEIAFLYFPYFACLASYHRIIGAMMGLPYAAIFFSVSMASDLQKCNDNTTWSDYVDEVLPKIPMIFCQLFIMGKFVLVLYQEIKNYGTCAVQFLTRDRREDEQSIQVKLTKPSLINHVRNLVNSRPSRIYSGIGFYLRKIYNPEKNFKFSTQTLSVVIVCLVLLYSISIELVFVASLNVETIRKGLAENTLTPQEKQYYSIVRDLIDCAIAATILASICCIISIIRFMECHKNNMLLMFKGDKSFVPKNLSVSQFIIGKGLRYHCFQIGYFLWGYILLLVLFLIICIAFYSLSFSIVQDFILHYIKGGGVIAGVAILTGLSLPLASYTIFRDYSYSKDVISINNRNVYLVFSYFWFFIGLPMGFFSAISRILKAMAVGVIMLPRIDHSIMPDGFQRLDNGFNAYICYLHVQTAYRNPVLRVFCQILCDETRSGARRKWTYSAQARNRWFLALTLIRNRQLASERNHDDVQNLLPVQPGGNVNHGDVNIEISQFGGSCDSRSGLLQDK